MALGPVTIYNANLNFLNPVALAAGSIKCALVNNSYIPDYSSTGDTIWANISSYEIANGNGYSTGGYALSNIAVSVISGGYKLSSSSAIWTASGGSISAWRRAVFYFYGTLGGLTNALIASVLGDDTPADVPATSSGITLVLNAPSNGWFTVKANI